MLANLFGETVRSRFYKYFVSYVLLTVILLSIVSGIVYKSFFATLSKEVQDSTVAMLTQVKNAMDMKVSEMNRMAVQLSANSALTPFMVEENGFALHRTVSELRKYKSTNMFIRDILLYFPSEHENRLYAASGIYDANVFFESVYIFAGWNKQELDRSLQKLTSPVMRPLEPVRVNGISSLQLSVYAHPLPANSDTRYGAVLFLIEESAIDTIVRNALHDYRGFMFIANERNEQIVRLANDETEEAEAAVWQSIADGKSNEMVSTITAGGAKYAVIRVKSEQNHWSYIAVMPTDQFMSKVNESRRLFQYTIAAVFVIGLLIALGFSLNNYRPLRHLIVHLKTQYQIGDLPRKADEFDLISRAVGEMNKRNEGLMNRLRSQSGALKDQYVLSLIHGKMKREDLEDTASFSPLALDKPHFVVLLFLIDDYGKFRRDYSESMRHMVSFGFLKMIEELAAEVGTGHGVELPDERGFVLLLNLDEGFGDLAYAREIGVKANRLFRQYSNMSVTVGIGDMHDDVSMTYQSYLQAGHAARHRFLQGRDRVILFRDIRDHDSKGVSWHPLEQEAAIVRAIRQGKSEEARAVIRDITDNIGQRQIPLRAAELICFDVVNTMIKTFIELELQADSRIDERLRSLIAAQYETMEELESMLTSLCDDLCAYIGKQTEHKHAGLTEKLTDFVAEHYCDSSISLESISSRFGLSPSYVTRIFKEHTGQPLMRYIDMMRMNKAKQLLKDSDMPLKDIMDEVGYIDATNFIRKFKKNEGITPIQYRTVVRGA
ncbi:hypothetical protein SD70_12230 [Gordoniibacillus kamchatkensis]|uniref:HTH araC/xylS-type domain-containing protein n=1 Tax=Gordoniibacillus kamchatkensis TaxID=1590651 RepID=A0ABR5AI84_9BACL|nr:helix-turn-helix domain-containing protein [Paenibacillus sp. VKM B-2647]KIL40671.1 hypothetical protein SD70_12230 [Paenibacillus sp. VKM B-2647]